MRYLRLALLVLCVLASVTSSASAAFPGRNGLLAIQPVKGFGVLLAGAGGDHRQLICADASCGVAAAPRWSADGTAIAFANPGSAEVQPEVRVVYPDGSCLNCLLAGASRPAFTPSGWLTAESAGRVEQFTSDGLRRSVNGTGTSDAVTSADGSLAIVRHGDVAIQSGPKVTRVGAGNSPSWAPGGQRLAYVNHGWIKIFNVRHGTAYRLIRGSSPAWSPDGQAIAFIGQKDSVWTISPTARHKHRIGTLRGLSVDWQPIPATTPAPCTAPRGSTIIASSSTAVITQDPATQAVGSSSAVMGCLLTDGRERSLGNFPVDLSYVGAGVSEAALAGQYAAVISFSSDFKDDGFRSQVKVYDLLTGRPLPGAGGESDGCDSVNCIEESNEQAITGLVLNSQGFTAVHIDDHATPEQIVASDTTGVHVLDSAPSSASQPALTGLALNGDTLTWNHNGQTQTAQLQ